MGGWYLQPDCNMPSGESIVRNILTGRTFFEKEFNSCPTSAINFDSFGHSRGLVQILNQAGYDSYVVCRPGKCHYDFGVGSPHTPEGYIWPIALCVQAMTSTDVHETAALAKAPLNTHAGTGFMHESFNPNDPTQFTRSWFAWANSMFGELMYRLYEYGISMKF